MAGRAETLIPTELIRQRSYEVWERNHCQPGLGLRFRLLGERHLRAQPRPVPADGGSA